MNGYGQNFDDFMAEQGLYDEAKERSAEKLHALEITQERQTYKGSLEEKANRNAAVAAPR